MKSLRTSILISFTVCLANAAQAGQCLRYGPAVVHLSGVIKPTMFYGPPNFGEEPKTDSKGSYPVLVLDKALCVAGDADSDGDHKSERKVLEMQMVFFDRYPFRKSWNGRHVQVTGSLFHADNAFHHTAVLITASRVSAAGAGQ